MHLAPSQDLVEVMLAALGDQLRSEQWRKDGGRYIPHPTTWLNQTRWEDEPVNSNANGHRPSGRTGACGASQYDAVIEGLPK